nr:balbiani ring protein 3-like isoform X2 [Leptinotarsa decemlineata]
MLKILVIVVFANVVLGCKWVCIDDKHRIMREYIGSEQFELDFQKHEIFIPQTDKKMHIVDRGRRLTDKPSLPENGPRLRMPALFVEPKENGPRLRMPAFSVEPKEVCSSEEFQKNMKAMSKKVKCKPRATIVDIKYEGGKVLPEKISTKLCSGGCSGTKTCLSVEKKNISMAVAVLVSGNYQCSRVVIPQDIKCKCGCDKENIKCLPSQVFDKKFCKCKCINEKEHHLCQKKIANHGKFVWNRDKCLCECKFQYICTTGTEWDRNQCRCTKNKKES